MKMIKEIIIKILEEKSDFELATSWYDSRVEGIDTIVDYINSHYIAKEKARKLVVVHLDNFFEQVIGTEVTKDDWFKLKKEIIDLMVEDNK